MKSILFKSSMLLGLLLAAPLYAAPHFSDIVVSDSKDGDATDTFAPSTAKIFVHAEMADIDKGAKMTGTWIAVDTHGAAPPNYKIDSSDLVADGVVNTVTYSLSKPNKGWPIGKYRVELAVDGKVVGSTSFTVEGDGG
jgi:hypothetical protein